MSTEFLGMPFGLSNLLPIISQKLINTDQFQIQHLKLLLANKPILKLYRLTADIEIHIDTSNLSIDYRNMIWISVSILCTMLAEKQHSTWRQSTSAILFVNPEQLRKNIIDHDRSDARYPYARIYTES
ncbi:hypothetical protein HZH66_011448 [Vespula vulgaris]|uniref:Uncharacterized protein n=1 Tax=Vespula vulgaris TaxID=7454 RepID=A0A834JFZ2_VESVU|nr:hypothetical protein HZH66_011448 [Vespula vulgaris]